MEQLAPVDLVVIGGGINGAGIARDAVGRGLSVILCEKDDLAQGTSSRSGKLITRSRIDISSVTRSALVIRSTIRSVT